MAYILPYTLVCDTQTKNSIIKDRVLCAIDIGKRILLARTIC
jgi:hypothetical protein